MFDESIKIPVGFLQVLNATLIPVAPDIFDQIPLAVALKFFCGHRRFNGIDALNPTTGVVGRVIDEISIRQEMARSQGWDQHSPREKRPQLAPTAQQHAGAHRGQCHQQARPWPHTQ